MLSETISAALCASGPKALATTGPHGVNVVPVSVIEVKNDQIYLYNFFMKKTVENIIAEPQVALSCWVELSGVQVKAVARYVTSGEEFDAAVLAMKERFPARVLSGIIVLTPTAVYDITADSAKAGTLIASA